MRLLDKKIVNAEIATQKKQLIDLGVTLAKKVDAIRETLQLEEKNVDTFRTETIARVKLEIDQKIRERDVVQVEITNLEKRRFIALLPLNEELVRIEKEKESLDNLKIGLIEQQELLIKRSAEIQNIEKKINESKERIEWMKERATILLSQTEELNKEAQKKSERIIELMHKSESEIEQRIAKIEVRERELVTRELGIGKRENKLSKQEEELAKSYKRLEDREATLARNINRIKNGRKG